MKFRIVKDDEGYIVQNKILFFWKTYYWQKVINGDMIEQEPYHFKNVKDAKEETLKNFNHPRKTMKIVEEFET